MKTIDISEREYEILKRTRNVEAGFDKLSRILRGVFILMLSALLLISAFTVVI